MTSNNKQQQDTAAPRSRRALFWLDFALPALLLALGTLLIRGLDLDLRWAQPFFLPDGSWSGKQVGIFEFLYDYGTLPALLLALAGLAVFIASWFMPRLSLWRRETGLFLALAMLLGPGLIVNTLLKDHWGRPRPRQLTEFRSEADTTRHYAFEEVLSIDPTSPGNSFPSGHASMGFYFFALFFLFRGRRLWLDACLLLLPLGYGFGMGYVRMAQGGHFASDVLWSGGLVYLVCAILFYLIKPQLPRPAATKEVI